MRKKSSIISHLIDHEKLELDKHIEEIVLQNQSSSGGGGGGGVSAETDPVYLASEAALFVAGDAAKLAGIAAGAEVNVNADWNSVGGDSQILNKPSIPTQYTDEMAQDAVGNNVGNGLDYDDATGAISVDETELTTFLKLNQSTPQNVTGGKPDFNAGLRAGSTDQLDIDASGNVNTSGTGTFGGSQAGQSTIASGLIVNNAGGGAAADDFIVKTDNSTTAFVVDASADQINCGVSFIPRTLSADPTSSATAGKLGEIAFYNNKWYGKTVASGTDTNWSALN